MSRREAVRTASQPPLPARSLSRMDPNAFAIATQTLVKATDERLASDT
jgi:hypothetical protein